ncbi:MAG: MMPL family transporter [Planctomycetota bacterium]
MIAMLAERLTRLVVRHPGAILTLLLAMTLAAVLALPSFRVESDVSALLPEDHPALELRRLTSEDESPARNLLVVLEGQFDDRNLLELASRLEALERVASVTATQAALFGEGASAPLHWLTPDQLALLEDRLIGDGRHKALSRLRERIADDPFAGPKLVRRDPLELRWLFEEARREALPPGLDGDAACLILESPPRAFLLLQGREAPYDVEFSKALLADVEAALAGHAFELVGGYVAARADEARLRFDLTVSAFASIGLVILFLTMSTRSRLEPLRIVAPCSLAVVWTLGFGSLALGPLSPLATASAAVLAGLGVDFSIHYVARFRHEPARDHEEALVRSARSVGPPIVIGALTSIVGFLSFTASRFHGLWSFGVLLASGLSLALLATFLVLPLALRGERSSPSRPLPIGPILRAARWSAESRLGHWIGGGTLLLAAAGWVAVLVGGLTFDADPSHLRPDDDPATAALHRVEETLGFSPVPVSVLVPGEVSLESCREALDRLRAEDAIVFALGPHRDVPTGEDQRRLEALRRSVNGWREGAAEDLRELGFVPEMFEEGFDQIDSWLAPAEAVPPSPAIAWRGDSFWMFRLYPTRGGWTKADRENLRADIRDVLGDEARAVMPIGLADSLGSLLEDDLVRCAWIAAFGALVILLLLLRSIRSVMTAALPTMTALGWTLGGMALTNTPLHLGNFVAVPLLVGIGLDDGIHLVSRLRSARRGAARASWSVILEDTGRPIWRTTATTTLAFGTLLLSRTPGLSSLGLLLAMGIAICFVTTLTTIPIFLPPTGGEPAGEAP